MYISQWKKRNIDGEKEKITVLKCGKCRAAAIVACGYMSNDTMLKRALKHGWIDNYCSLTCKQKADEKREKERLESFDANLGELKKLGIKWNPETNTLEKDVENV